MGIYASSSPMDEKKLSFLHHFLGFQEGNFKFLGEQINLFFFGVELGEHSLEFMH